ncbi:MAG: amidohydrolase [Spirochaetia bacterium]
MTDVLFSGGTILTMDSYQPRAEAMLIRENRIVAVGPRRKAMAEATHSEPVEIDLKGRTVIPGFNDSHIHVTQLGDRGNSLDLSGMNKAQILESVVEKSQGLKPGAILTGYQWDYPACPDPHLRDLDELVPDRAVLLFQFSGHGAWANSKALALLGISRDTPDWEIGGPDRDEDGELNGIVRELGGAPGIRRLFIKQLGNRKEAGANLQTAMERLREHGITSVQDNTWFPWVVGEIGKLNRRGEQSCRISCWSPGFLGLLDLWFSLKRFNRYWYSRGPRKFFLDGAFSSHTAWLDEPYADKRETSGAGRPVEKIIPWIRRATRQGRQIACHSIGDAATGAYLDAMATMNGPRTMELRHRIEHGQLIRERDIERIVKFGMVVSAQPQAAGTPEKDRALLGPERAVGAYPYRSLIDAGVHLAFGSDYPGELTFEPLLGVHLAVNREGGQAITPEEAIACYTAGSAWAEFKENEKGKLKSGYLCDIAVLSADPTKVDSSTIKDITVDATIVNGKLVYLRSGTELRPGMQVGTDLSLARAE